MAKDTLKRIISHAIIVIVAYLLQAAFFSGLKVGGAAPLILPLVAVGIGLFDGGLWGGIWGVVCGLLCDVSLTDSGSLFTVYLAIAGFFTGFLSEFVLARGFPSFFTVSVVTLVIAALLQLAGPFFYHGAPLSVLWKPALIQIVYSALFILPVYYPVHRATRSTRRVRI